MYNVSVEIFIGGLNNFIIVILLYISIFFIGRRFLGVIIYIFIRVFFVIIKFKLFGDVKLFEI